MIRSFQEGDPREELNSCDPRTTGCNSSRPAYCLYTAAFRRLLRDSGVKPVILPAWSPNLNAFAERFVASAKSECLERMVLLGEPHLRASIRAYHEERPHQGLGNELIGGLLKFYEREAA